VTICKEIKVDNGQGGQIAVSLCSENPNTPTKYRWKDVICLECLGMRDELEQQHKAQIKQMKTHAVKEVILGCLLRVEVEPQPYEGLKVGITYPPPIRIGDTVYRGRECLFQTDALRHSWNSPETMPIELADKTYKVIGIEVELKDIHYGDGVKCTQIVKKWCWNYKLEEIK